jgi:hypothetical protein
VTGVYRQPSATSNPPMTSEIAHFASKGIPFSHALSDRKILVLRGWLSP